MYTICTLTYINIFHLCGVLQQAKREWHKVGEQLPGSRIDWEEAQGIFGVRGMFSVLIVVVTYVCVYRYIDLYLSKLIQLYTYNSCILSYINFTSVKMILNG